jgi:heme A synthase
MPAVVTEIHKYVAFVVVAIFSVGWIWGGFAWIRKRDPSDRFWTWLAVAQVLAGVQALIGIILLALGKRPDTPLHYVYGFGPIVVLVIAHQVARERSSPAGEQAPLPPWVPFAIASFFCFGLTLRALMTGLGAP